MLTEYVYDIQIKSLSAFYIKKYDLVNYHFCEDRERKILSDKSLNKYGYFLSFL
jgi:hypothetical protein